MDAPIDTAKESSGEAGGDDGGIDAPPGDDGGMDQESEPSCDPLMPPSDEPCVIDEQYGVFLSPNGTDGPASGTKAMPFKTFGAAMAKAKSAGKRVYACAGNYDEHLVVDTTRDGVDVFGGLDCAMWSYNRMTNVVTLAPTTAGLAMKIDSIAKASSFTDVGFTSKPGVSAGESSIAVFVTNAMGVVTFTRAAIAAGAGVPGTDGAAPPGQASRAPSGADGTMGAPGGNTPNPTCMMSVGGGGGRPVAGGENGLDGAPTSFGMNHGDHTKACNSGGGGGNGANGPAGISGLGAASLGMLDASGWVASTGTAGGPGGLSQGGGGGASVDTMGGGGGGGPGGCGALGGTLGGGGGASLALLIFQSSVSLNASALTTAAAGRGGNGADGQIGQAGGFGGNKFMSSCTGGNGGTGGSGGGGGGGAGGVSAGILWKGTAPTIDGTQTMQANMISGWTIGALGAAGLHGHGGVAGSPGANAGMDGTDGVPGLAKAVTPAP